MRRSSNPLEGWRQGTPPTQQSQPAQPRTQPAEDDFDWNPHSRQAILMQRAVMLVRNKYGITKAQLLDRWDESKDREAKRVYLDLMEGQHTPSGYEGPSVRNVRPQHPATMPELWSRQRLGG